MKKQGQNKIRPSQDQGTAPPEAGSIEPKSQEPEGQTLWHTQLDQFTWDITQYPPTSSIQGQKTSKGTERINEAYGLAHVGNRYYYAIHGQAFVVEMEPRPIAWRKTPSTPWQRTHGNVLRLDILGFGVLYLDPFADFDRSSTMVYKLVPSTGRFEFEPDWNDSIPYTDWAEDNDWKEIVSDLMGEIEPGWLEKLREFSHFHMRLMEALSEWPGFEDLLNANPALAVCLAGRIRVGAQGGETRPRLDYGSLVQRSEKEIAAALGFGDSEDVVSILRKLPPDACKPLELMNFPKFIENPITRKALTDADVINYLSLLFLRNPYLADHLTGQFLTDIAKLFPHSNDILTCPWGPLLRGGGKEDEFTWRYQQALDVVEFAEDPKIHSIEELKRKHSAVFMTAYNSRYSN